MTRCIVTALCFTVSTLSISLSLGDIAAVKVWATAWFCYLTLVCLTLMDCNNLLRLRCLRFFPMILFGVYGLAVITISAVLQDMLSSPGAAVYVALLIVAAADFCGQVTVGQHHVALLGRDHIGRRTRYTSQRRRQEKPCS